MITLAKNYATPYTKIEVGAMPAENGLSMYLGAGAPNWSYLNRGSVQTVAIVLNGKHSNQQTVVSVLSSIHKGLSQLIAYPSSTEWSILDIRTVATPNYIDHENSNQWVYGSIFDIIFWVKGE